MTRSTTKQALLDRWKRGSTSGAVPSGTIPRRGDVRELRLSFPQQRLWFLDRFDEGRTAYNIGATFRLTGALDPERLARSLTEIVCRHEALRATFHEVDGTPLQAIASELTLPLPILDLRDLPSQEKAKQIEQVRRTELTRRFDLATGPLLRTLLAHCSDTEHLLFLTRHHIVADAWSLALFIDELLAHYEALSTGSPANLEALPIQYADYALWQRRRVDTDLAAQIAYWTRQLDGAPRVLDLPFDRAMAGPQGAPGALCRFEIPAALADALRSFGRAEHATNFMTLLAAFQALLARYSQSDDVVVGCPIANRNRAEVERLIGVFANTVVMRADLSGNPSFRVFLGRIREACLAAYTHQDVPFERLVELIQPHRDTGRSPLFQAMFVLQDAPRQTRPLPSLGIELVEIDTAAAMFDVTLALTESATGLHGALEYNTGLFEAETMARLARHYVRLLGWAVAHPDRPLSEWPWLDADERQAVLAEAGATAREESPTPCVHELFEAQVARTPDAIAVCDEEQALTYAALNHAANQVGRRLRARGVGPDVRVAICLERSVDLVVAILGVLKAGGAYVPIDPQTPRQRLEWMVADTGAPVMVTEASLRVRVTVGGVQIVEVPIAEEGAAEPSTLSPVVGPDNLAYVIYTSGSTGTPKGVLVTHANVVRSTAARTTFYREPVRAFLLPSAVTFDSSVAGLFWTLCSGGTLVLPSDEAASQPTALGHLIARHRISHVLTIPLLYRSILDEVPASSLGVLRTVIVAGEACPVGLVEHHYKTVPHVELVNEYGPTEATVWSTAFRCVAGAGTTVPIGRPIAGTRACIVDKHLDLVPPGVIGELCLGGAGITRGYLHRADLTAERFVADPFGSAPGERMYQTGDLARYRSDGQLEFVGRRDRQVKLRGVRIELGELEHLIARHPQVAEAAVAVLGHPDRQRLAAFVVVSGTSPPTAAELETFVRRHVPGAMVPATFAVIERLPRLSNGKIDYAALRDLDAPGVTHDLEPRTQTEALLAQIWSELLKLERVDVNASFFELGGHSLLASRLLARARETFAVDLPLRVFFDAPTIAGLAASIEAARPADKLPPPPPIVARTRAATRFPLSFAQERLWFLDGMNPRACTYNVPTAARLMGQLDRRALAAAIRTVVQRHDILRTCFELKDGQPLQRVWQEADVPLRTVNLGGITGPARDDALAKEMAAEARSVFDLTRAPLLRATLLQLDADEHVLLITTHHIITDAWSLNVLFAELGAAYAGVLGQQTSLPPLRVQYADYAVWQRDWLSGGGGEAHLEYWKGQLGNGTSATELKTDRPRPPMPSMRGAVHAFELPQSLSDDLSRLTIQERVTPFMVFLGGFAALLHRYTEHDDIVVGTPVAGRRRPEIEGLIGFFVNMLVLRIDCSANPAFRELLHRVRQVCLDADAHQDVPFERVVEALHPTRDLSRQALFQMAIAVQNAPDDMVYVPGLKLVRLATDTGTAKFDLTLTFTQREARWHGALEYNTDLFEAETMARLARHYVRLLAEAAAHPDRPLSECPWLEANERRAVLAEAGARAREESPTQCVHELFEAQVARTPDAIAVCEEGRELTYAALNHAATEVARRLRARGVGPDVRVAICLERSVDLVVAILGVLKAGGAYVPIDPETPRERLVWMVADTGAPVMVTQATLRARVAVGDVQIVEVPVAEDAADEPSALDPVVGPAHLAYVIYTSGSTGTPKGVLVTHANVVRLLSATQNQFQFNRSDVWTLFHSAAFDFSVWELFGALLTGGRAVVVSREVQRSPDAFYRMLLSERVTVLNQTPSAFRHLARVAAASRASDDLALRLVIFGGEAVDLSQLEAWFDRFGDVHPRLVNMYGITETTVHVTYRALTRRDLETRWVSPIGRPLRDLSAFILDRHQQPLPRGVPGELYVGGAGVARGYLGRPDLTAERFVPDPYGDVPGARLYRTGDRARLRSDGELEYLGRVDQQIKVRGFRIETGEIEAALSSHSSVRDCVVVGLTDQPGDTQIVSYVVPSAVEKPRPEILREWLSERLPAYMLPAAFVFLEALPRTSGGKVDRKALPPPRADRPDLESEYVAPKGALEQRIAALWATVLHVEKVGVRDNFFSLGGSSLRLAQVHGLLQETLAVSVPMVTLFKYPTVRSLADHLQSKSRGPTAAQQGHARAKARRDSLREHRLVERIQGRTEPSDADRIQD